MTAPLVVGADLSLTSTGLACSDGRTYLARTRVAGGGQVADGLARMCALLACMRGFGVFAADLLVVEGPSLGQMRQTGEHVRAGLWWMVADRVHGVTPLLVVPPAVLKVYATGKGNASKDQVLAAVVKRYPSWDVTGNDVADAVALMAIGARLLGHPVEDSLPQSHLRALDKLALPADLKEVH